MANNYPQSTEPILPDFEQCSFLEADTVCLKERWQINHFEHKKKIN